MWFRLLYLTVLRTHVLRIKLLYSNQNQCVAHPHRSNSCQYGTKLINKERRCYDIYVLCQIYKQHTRKYKIKRKITIRNQCDFFFPQIGSQDSLKSIAEANRPAGRNCTLNILIKWKYEKFNYTPYSCVPTCAPT